MTAAKYKVFIGCSTEARTVAQALRYELRDVADGELWSQGLFQVGRVVLDELVKAVDGYDFGIFVFRPDDVVTMRKKEYSAVRDNVLFELGVFVGKLGPQRSLFVVPSADDQLRLPSDLSGIIPARYDSENPNPQKAVAGAAFELSNAFRALGPIPTRGGVLYDSKRDPNSKFLQGRESYLYKDDKRISDKAEASLSFGPDGLLTINRRNNLGRFEIHFRPQGPGRPSFRKTTDAPLRRSLRVSCDIKAESAAHKVRFVAKDEESDEWLAKETKMIEPGDWNALELYLWLDPTKDFLFRIDDEDVTAAPATLSIRNLIIEETS